MTINDLWLILIIAGLFYAFSTSPEERDMDLRKRKMRNHNKR